MGNRLLCRGDAPPALPFPFHEHPPASIRAASRESGAASRGHEHGETPGLDWISGDVLPVERTDPAIKVPHMGWNDVALLPHAREHPVLEGGEAYFLHSYHFVADDGQNVAAMTDHGGGIVAAVSRGNVAGVQFHPEKSQHYGIAMLRRFLDWQP